MSEGAHWRIVLLWAGLPERGRPLKERQRQRRNKEGIRIDSASLQGLKSLTALEAFYDPEM
jgi:hypothetical protein